MGVIAQLWDSCVYNQIATFGLLDRQSSVTLNIGLNIGCSHNRDNRPSEQSAKCNIGQALLSILLCNWNCKSELVLLVIQLKCGRGLSLGRLMVKDLHRNLSFKSCLNTVTCCPVPLISKMMSYCAFACMYVLESPLTAVVLSWLFDLSQVTAISIWFWVYGNFDILIVRDSFKQQYFIPTDPICDTLQIRRYFPLTAL